MGITYRKHDLYPESILIRDFEGEVSVNDIIESWEYIATNKLIADSTKGIINNLSGCNLLMDMKSFNILISYLKKQEYLSEIKLAVICDNPGTIIFPALGESKERALQIKPFSTMDAAVKWVIVGLF